jgi:hypothetical protein
MLMAPATVQCTVNIMAVAVLVADSPSSCNGYRHWSQRFGAGTMRRRHDE